MLKVLTLKINGTYWKSVDCINYSASLYYPPLACTRPQNVRYMIVRKAAIKNRQWSLRYRIAGIFRGYPPRNLQFNLKMIFEITIVVRLVPLIGVTTHLTVMIWLSTMSNCGCGFMSMNSVSTLLVFLSIAFAKPLSTIQQFTDFFYCTT